MKPPSCPRRRLKLNRPFVKLAKLQMVRTRIIQKINAKILSLPDNPRIKRMPGPANCFVIQFKDLGSSWSPEHHDFKKTYKLIVETLNRASDDDFLKCLLGILEDGRVKLQTSGTHYLTLHPDVVTYVYQLLQGEKLCLPSNTKSGVTAAPSRSRRTKASPTPCSGTSS